MKVAIHQPHYMPWLGYFAKWADADLFVLLDTVQFEKNGWQNRNRIKTRDGVRWLTVPVRASLGTPIKDVTIDESQPWPGRHLRMIEHAYAKAPCWPRWRDQIRAFYGGHWTHLAPLAADSALWLARELDIAVPTRLSSQIALPEGDPKDATARLVALCQAVGADTYLAGADSSYMDLDQFAAAGISVETQHFEHPTYAQEHGKFEPFLSALDLLLMQGDEALGALRRGSTWSRQSPGPR